MGLCPDLTDLHRATHFDNRDLDSERLDKIHKERLGREPGGSSVSQASHTSASPIPPLII